MKNAMLVVPKELCNIIAWAIGASNDPEMTADLADETNAKILSISQDIVYLKFQGWNPTPKTLSLALAMRHLTGSAQVVDILNKFGHTVSYSSTLQLESGLAQLRLLQKDHIPEGFHPQVHTNLEGDNIDFNEETVTDAGTTHHANGNIIQSNVNRNNESFSRPSVIKSRAFIKEKSNFLSFFITTKEGPRKISDVVVNVSLQECLELTLHSQFLDFWYVLNKFTSDSCLPNWKSFNTSLQSHSPLQKSLIHYLPVIEHPPNDLASVKEIINQSLLISNRLQLNEITLIFDQAIYCKAQLIRWKDHDIWQKTIVRLGEFHIAMSFLKVLGKRFCDAGLQNVVIEAGLVAVGSINSVMN